MFFYGNGNSRKRIRSNRCENAKGQKKMDSVSFKLLNSYENKQRRAVEIHEPVHRKNCCFCWVDIWTDSRQPTAAIVRHLLSKLRTKNEEATETMQATVKQMPSFDIPRSIIQRVRWKTLLADMDIPRIQSSQDVVEQQKVFMDNKQKEFMRRKIQRVGHSTMCIRRGDVEKQETYLSAIGDVLQQRPRNADDVWKKLLERVETSSMIHKNDELRDRG